MITFARNRRLGTALSALVALGFGVEASRPPTFSAAAAAEPRQGVFGAETLKVGDVRRELSAGGPGRS